VFELSSITFVGLVVRGLALLAWIFVLLIVITIVGGYYFTSKLKRRIKPVRDKFDRGELTEEEYRLYYNKAFKSFFREHARARRLHKKK